MKPLLILSFALVLCDAVQAQFPTAGVLAETKNLTADVPIAAATNYKPHDILVVKYTAPSVALGAATQYELFIDGVAEIENTSATDQTVDIIVTNSSPLCGEVYGLTGPFGPGRVLTVTVPAGHFVVVPVSVIDFISAGNASSAHLQYRHASGPGLVAKANSYLDVKEIPASSLGVNNTPFEGPANCPAE